MELISGLMTQQKTQSAEEIIPMLCDRLAHATLASDKRAAILTLKGFAREYRELVIANGLRALISTIREYTMETEIIKASLETMLVLFIRGEGEEDQTRAWISQQSRTQNGKYPSPLLMKQDQQSTTIDQFSLWIADEVTQGPENIAAIVSLLENTDFYVRLYTLQLLEALVSMRSNKTKDLLLNAPLGIPCLIQVLDDVHDPVRNEAVLLLMAVANDNFNIQKLVAFENTFDKLFEIIHEEGDIRGSIVVQDCLTLLSNLLKYNVSNQKLFLETNCLPKLAYLLAEPLDEQDEIMWNDQRLQNVEIALEIVSLFVLDGNESTKANQDAFFQADIFLTVLRLAFSSATPNSLRPSALRTVADLIAKNSQVQLSFSAIDVPYIDPSLPKQLQRFKDPVPVVIALLNWCLFVNSVHVFDIRVAAAQLLTAYFDENNEGKLGFIQDQIAAYYNEDNDDEEPDDDEESESPTTGSSSDPETPERLENQEDELDTPATNMTSQTNGTSNTNGTMSSLEPKDTPIANVFAALLEYDPEQKLNPYKVWFSSIILIHLIHDNDELKRLVREVHTGDEEAGEEKLSAIQAMSGLLLTTLTSQDQRISIGYLSLLIVLLFEDFASVDDFLSDTSTLRSLLQYLAQPSFDSGLVQGLVTVLVGVAFEFSRQGSPLSRVDLHSLIIKMVGKDSYGFKILQFKENSYFVNFNDSDILNPSRDETGLPEVFLDPIIVTLIKENYYRIKNALNQDPTLESNGRISYEKFEELQDQYQELKTSYEDYQEQSKAAKKEIDENLAQTTSELKQTAETLEKTQAELEELKSNHATLDATFKETSLTLENLQKLHAELADSSHKQSRDLESTSEQLTTKDIQIANLKQELKQVQEQKKKAEDGINKMSRELFQLTRDKEDLEKKVKKLEKDIQNNLKQQEKLEKSLKQKTEESVQLKTKLGETSKALRAAEDSKSSLEKALKETTSKNQKNESLVEQMTEKLRFIALTCQELTTAKEAVEEELGLLREQSARDIDSYKTQVQELESANSELLSLSDGLKSEKSKLEAAVEESKKALSDGLQGLQAENQSLESTIDGLKIELDASKQLCAKHESQIRYLNAQVKATKDELNGLKESHAISVKETADAHNKALGSVQRELSNHKESHKTEVEKLKSSLKELTSHKDTVTRELETHKTDLSKLKKDLEDKQVKIADITKELDERQAEVEDLRKSNSELENNLYDSNKEFKRKITETQHRIDQLTKVRSNLESELDDLAAEFEGKEAEYKKEIKTLSEKIKSVEEEKKSLTSTLEMISQRIETKDMESESLMKNLKSKSAAIDELTQQKSDLESEKKSIEESLQAAKDQVEALQSDVGSLKEQLESSNEKLEKSESSVKSTQQRLEEQKKKGQDKICNLENEIKTLKEAIEKKTSDFEKERALLSENSSSTTKEYSEKVTKLEDELQKLQTSFGSKTEVLEKEKVALEETVSELKSFNETLEAELKSKDSKLGELKSNIKENESKLKDLESKLSLSEKEAAKLTPLEKQLQESTSKVEKLEKTVAEKDQQLKETHNKLEVSMAAIEKLERDVERLQKELSEDAASAEQVKSALDVKVKKLETELYELRDENGSLRSQLETANTEGDESLEKEKAVTVDLTKKIDDLESQLKQLTTSTEAAEQAKSKAEKELSDIQESSKITIGFFQSKDSELAELKAKHESLMTEVAETKLEKEKLAKETEAKTALEAVNQRLQDELKKLKESMVPKSELDDLMLVLDDLDEKKKKYKAQAKTLGGEVSSDEEEDDNDDDDDDDDSDDE